MSPVSSQQDKQRALTTLLLRDLNKAWEQLDPNRLSDTLPQWTTLVAALTRKYGQASGAIAARFYEEHRRDAGVKGQFRVLIADPAPLPQVAKGLGWATRGLWLEGPDLAAAQTLSDGVAQKAVLQVARGTLFNAAAADRKAAGWVREAEPAACSFCLMLAIRGPVYKTERTAGGGGSEPFHDHCHCLPVPVFGTRTSYHPPAHVLQAQELYARSTAGLSGAEARNAFRRAVEGSSGE